MNKKPLVKELVADVLANNDNGYMTVADIAEKAFGDAYIGYTYKALDEKVRRSIYGAISILSEQGIVVIGLKNEKLKGNIIDRWKIVGEEDVDELNKVITEKTARVNGYVSSRNRLIENAMENELLPDAEQLKLK
jgi:hypothetical protein